MFSFPLPHLAGARVRLQPQHLGSWTQSSYTSLVPEELASAATDVREGWGGGEHGVQSS